MYSFFNEISSWFSGPLLNLAESVRAVPLLFTFILGVVGALAPCQFVTNISAVTLYGNRSLQKNVVWKDVFGFVIGKIVAFSLLGILVWIVGREAQENLTVYFPWLRKMIGPLLLVVGLFMMGFIRLNWTIKSLKFPWFRNSGLSSFFLGFSFSLAFCPTMFVLFFVTLMPIALSHPTGLVLPPMFALGTSLPLLIVMYFIWEFGGKGSLLKKGRMLGEKVQRIAGVFMILLGILEIMTYWQ
ncbi:sulfite exporter TauE/SafE family protein [Peribacillus acanthi]|uniref:urease accessory protein UreH domain-containing protein n=1 Tax=Peribacillus acanthi TaxID=2171554 RepID=UPI000D3EC502|nr:sulfite exporter TauE/SafE family protein [Peribacillus acanthi]